MAEASTHTQCHTAWCWTAIDAVALLEKKGQIKSHATIRLGYSLKHVSNLLVGSQSQPDVLAIRVCEDTRLLLTFFMHSKDRCRILRTSYTAQHKSTNQAYKRPCCAIAVHVTGTLATSCRRIPAPRLSEYAPVPPGMAFRYRRARSSTSGGKSSSTFGFSSS